MSASVFSHTSPRSPARRERRRAASFARSAETRASVAAVSGGPGNARTRSRPSTPRGTRGTNDSSEGFLKTRDIGDDDGGGSVPVARRVSPHFWFLTSTSSTSARSIRFAAAFANTTVFVARGTPGSNLESRISRDGASRSISVAMYSSTESKTPRAFSSSFPFSFSSPAAACSSSSTPSRTVSMAAPSHVPKDGRARCVATVCATARRRLAAASSKNFSSGCGSKSMRQSAPSTTSSTTSGAPA